MFVICAIHALSLWIRLLLFTVTHKAAMKTVECVRACLLGVRLRVESLDRGVCTPLTFSEHMTPLARAAASLYLPLGIFHPLYGSHSDGYVLTKLNIFSNVC